MEIEEKLADMPAKEKFKFLYDSLVGYGIPSEVIDELDGTSVVELLEIINGTKKN